MATERLSMRKIREILRQKWALARSHRQVAASLTCQRRDGDQRPPPGRPMPAWTGPRSSPSPTTTLEARLYGARATPAGAPGPLPDCAYLHAERKQPGVTLELLHLEYLEQHPGRLPLHPLLRPLPPVARPAPALHAPGPSGRREDLRRLRRAEAATSSTPRPARSSRGRALRRRPRGQQLHLRRGDGHAAAPRLAREPRSGCSPSLVGSARRWCATS